MIKKIISKIKEYWKKFLKFIFKKWIPEEQSSEQVWEGLYKWIVINRPEHLNYRCPVCGSKLTIKNIEEKHFMKNHIIIIYRCEKKCNLNIQRRFTHGMIEIKKM